MVYLPTELALKSFSWHWHFPHKPYRAIHCHPDHPFWQQFQPMDTYNDTHTFRLSVECAPIQSWIVHKIDEFDFT